MGLNILNVDCEFKQLIIIYSNFENCKSLTIRVKCQYLQLCWQYLCRVSYSVCLRTYHTMHFRGLFFKYIKVSYSVFLEN